MKWILLGVGRSFGDFLRGSMQPGASRVRMAVLLDIRAKIELIHRNNFAILLVYCLAILTTQ